MDFLEAVEEMKKEKKVTRSSYKEPIYFILNDVGILRKFNSFCFEDYVFNIDDFEADDWKVVEEPKKTLYEKLQYACINHKEGNVNTYFKPEDVNEALNELIYWLNNEDYYGKMIDFEGRVRNKVKEIFGEELLK